MPLYRKVQITQNRIIEWYQHFNGQVYISLSGGKDSAVLLHIARQIFPDIKACFCNTGLEYPEVQAFAKGQENVDVIRPKMSFVDVITDYGYPLVSKEVAEAIYYARRKLPKDFYKKWKENNANNSGGGLSKARQELLGIRQNPFMVEREVKTMCWQSDLPRTQTAGELGTNQRVPRIPRKTRGGGVQIKTKLRKEAEFLGLRPSESKWGGVLIEEENTHSEENIPSSEQSNETASILEDADGKDGTSGSAYGRYQRGQEILTKKSEMLGKYTGDRKSLIEKAFNVAQSNVESLPTTKSLFNKEKWLPLAVYAPFRISHYCCNAMKKSPMKTYERQTHLMPILATMTEESRLRKTSWLKNGCNAFEAKRKMSQPMSFWTEQDVLMYIKLNNLDIAAVYGDVIAVDKKGQIHADVNDPGCHLKTTGVERTGCIFCGFGLHSEKGETRFQKLKKTHPRQYEYCMEGGQWVDNPEYDPDYDGEPDPLGWIEWNPPKLWIPSKEGLGMRKVFEICNEIYGEGFYRYE